MRQRTLGGESFEPERKTCQWGAMCPEEATHVGHIGRSEVLVCEECVDAHDLFNQSVLPDLRELRPGERVARDEYERVDTAQEPGWSP